MTGWVRHVVTAVLAAAVTSALAVAVNLATDLKDSGWAWLAVGLLTAVSAAGSLYVSWSSAEPARDADLDEILETLAVTSESMWSRALRHRGLKVEQLIDVPWDAIPHGRSNGDRHRTITGPLRARTTSEQDIKDTATVILRERARILIVGRAGAGKSSLARRLAYACVRLRASGDPVPVVLSTSTWTVGEPIPRWMERELIVACRGLTRKTERNMSIARQLIEQRRVFPVLDGLDELPHQPRAEFGEALRDWLPEDSPLLITCRTGDTADPAQAQPRLPLDTVLVMRPVEPDDALNALREGASAEQERTWERLLEACRREPTGPLAQTLSTPLMLAMATEIYHGGRGDPAELERLPDRNAMEDHLLGSFLRTMARRRTHSPNPTVSEYPEKKVLDWLTFLAQHLNRRGTYDLRWWELRSAVSPRGSLLGVSALAGLIVTVAAIPPLGLLRGPTLGVCSAGLVYLEIERLRPPGQPQRVFSLGSLNISDYLRRVRTKLWRRFATGAAGGIGMIWLLGAATWGLSKVVPEFTRQALSGGGIFPNLLEVDPIIFLTGTSLIIGVFLGGLLAFNPDPFDHDVVVEFLKRSVLGRGSPEFAANQPVELARAANPRHTLGQDRRWSLLFLAFTAVSTILAITITTSSSSTRQGFPLVGPLSDHVLSWTILCVVVFSLGVFLRAEWPWFIAARIPLTVGGRIPPRLVSFLDTMDSWDVLRREGDVYRFRHAVLRDWLLKQAAKDRCRSLDARWQQMLRQLMLYPGPEITAELAAHVKDIPLAEAERGLEEFCQAELMTCTEGRYRWTAGSRAAVTELAASEPEIEPPGLRGHIRERIRDFYRELFVSYLLDPAQDFVRPFPLSMEGWRRLRAELDNVLACVRHSARDGDIDYTVEMSMLVMPYLRQWHLDVEGRELLEAILAQPVPEWAELRLRYELARLSINPETVKGLIDRVLELANRNEDRRYEVLALCRLADLQDEQSSEVALATATLAVQLAEKIDCSDCHAAAVNCQGRLHLTRDPVRAQPLFATARKIAQEAGGRVVEADSLVGVGRSLLYQNDAPQAVTNLDSGRRIYEEIGAFSAGAENALLISYSLWKRNQPAQAKLFVVTAIRNAKKVPDPQLVAEAQSLHGRLLYELSDPKGALRPLLLAQQQFAKDGERGQEAIALFVLGLALVETGESLIRKKRDGEWALVEGRARLDQARKAFADSGNKRSEADVSVALGQATADGTAKLWLTHALELYEALEDPAVHETIEQVRSMLSHT
ncbi:MAG: NACHT domain-containing protein [Pseudonocardiaceae bacterium]